MPTVKASQPALFAEITINENNLALITGTLRDETGAPVLLSALTSLTLTLFDRATDVIINSRNDQTILNANGGSCHPTSGAFTLTLGPADNPIVDVTIQTGLTEAHTALIEAAWSGNGYWSGIAQVKVRQVHRVP